MPTNHTVNYQLSQWERTDKVLMEDFNADNAKIDGALAAQAEAHVALAAEVAKCGNCQIYYATYIGTGSHPGSYTFPAPPIFLVVLEPGRGYAFFAVRGASSARLNEGNVGSGLTWDGATVKWNSTNETANMNIEGRGYAVMALLAADES